MKKYIVIRDYQGGSFGMYRDYTAKEWGEQAYQWASQDDWENPEECLLKNFKTEKDLINFIIEMWEIELVELDKNNKEVIEFLKECAKENSNNFYYCNYCDIEWARKVLKELGVKLCKN